MLTPVEKCIDGGTELPALFPGNARSESKIGFEQVAHRGRVGPEAQRRTQASVHRESLRGRIHGGRGVGFARLPRVRDPWHERYQNNDESDDNQPRKRWRTIETGRGADRSEK